MADLLDKRLIARLRHDDGIAFERLFTKYNRKLFNFSIKILRSRTEAEGIVQETFISVWENRHKLDPSYSLNGYLYKIARNKIYNLMRIRINEKYYREYLWEYAIKLENSLEEKINQDELQEIYNDLVDKLPARRREIFILSRDRGLTYKEIAGKLEISENTVDTQIRKALDHFRTHLRNKYLSLYS